MLLKSLRLPPLPHFRCLLWQHPAFRYQHLCYKLFESPVVKTAHVYCFAVSMGQWFGSSSVGWFCLGVRWVTAVRMAARWAWRHQKVWRGHGTGFPGGPLPWLLEGGPLHPWWVVSDPTERRSKLLCPLWPYHFYHSLFLRRATTSSLTFKGIRLHLLEKRSIDEFIYFLGAFFSFKNFFPLQSTYNTA